MLHAGHVVMADGSRELRTNAELIDLLRRELERARSGAVQYSPESQKLMARELAAREGHASVAGTGTLRSGNEP